MALADLNPARAAAKGAELHLKHPATGEPLFETIRGRPVPVTIRILGRDSDAVQNATRDIEKRRAKGETISAEAAGLEVMAAAVAGWSAALGIAKPGDLPFNASNARALLENPDAKWVAEQIGPFSMNRRNFLLNQT